MKLGYIGLGKMGYNMVERLLEKGHSVVAYDTNDEAVSEIEEQGAVGVSSLEALVTKTRELDPENPITLWLMIPWKFVDATLKELTEYLQEGDVVIDGGNSPYTETIRRSEELAGKGIRFMDVGVSGGPEGARFGACLMIGGEEDLYAKYEDLFKDLSVPEGYGHMGAVGTGHYVKMVHNGIEYGMMQAIGEGFGLMRKSGEFKIDLTEVARVYNKGSVIQSSLVQWLHDAYEQDGEDLERISGEISHSGEGQWTVEAAEREGIKLPIIEGSLQFRKDSEGNPSYIGQVVSALRNQFGGHNVDKSSQN